MLEPTFRDQIPAFREKKVEQLEAVAARGDLPGLQYSSTDAGTTFILRYSVEGFEDHIIIGRAPRVQTRIVEIPEDRASKRRARITQVAVPEGSKMATKQKIDLSSSDIAAVIEGWRRGTRAIETLDGLAGKRGQEEELTPGEGSKRSPL